MLATDKEVLQHYEYSNFNKFTRCHKGTVSKETILQGVIKGDFYGFLVVDIHVPQNCKDRFEDFPPLFANHDVDIDDIGEHMRNHMVDIGSNLKKRRLLISDMQATEILLSSELLKFYLDQGLECTQIYQTIEYVPIKVFTDFVKKVTERRLEGAIDPNKKAIANLWKLSGNAAYGSTILNKFKYTRIRHVNNSREARLLVNDSKFRSLSKLGSQDIYEVQLAPARTLIDTPIQIGVAILLGAKLKLLKFYYEFVCKHVDKADFAVMQIDTDSMYLSLSGRNLLETIKKDHREIIRQQLEDHCKTERDPDSFLCRTCCDIHQREDCFHPGLLKLEFACKKMICLNSKTYICSDSESGKIKFSCKGLNKCKISKSKHPTDLYHNVLKTGVSQGDVNVGFKLHQNSIYTYSQQREAFSYLYLKRQVIDAGGVYTVPLDIMLRPANQPNILCIQNGYMVLSNQYKCPFKHGLQTYSSALQAFVILCIRSNITNKTNQEQMVNQVMSDSSGYNVWRVFNQIERQEDWKVLEYSCMRGIVESRLREIPKMMQALLSTGVKSLINADKCDSFFGTGENKHVVRWLNESDIPGRNYLGDILMTLRESVKNGK